ncbi:MAG: DUF418 domain-containing protein [Natronospirillum sp.]
MDVRGQAKRPSEQPDRAALIDALRGFAVLGILPVNLLYFAWPQAAVPNPLLWVNADSMAFTLRSTVHVFFEQKFISLLSLLFGVSLGLFSAQHGPQSGPRHYRRMLALLLLGLLHAYGLWYGDILVLYAVCGILAWPLRNESTQRLVYSGLILLAVPSMLLLAMGYSLPYWPPDVISGLALNWQPTDAAIRQEIAAYQGDWITQGSARLPAAWGQHTDGFLHWGIWRTWGLILIGVAIARTRLWETSVSSRTLYALAILAGGTGILLVHYGWTRMRLVNFEFEYSVFFGNQWNYWGSLPMAAAYALVLTALMRSPAILARGAIARLASVGRYSLTVYLSQTIIGTTLYYGHGLGWFGMASTLELATQTLITWLMILTLVPLLNRRYPHGPAEWLWRTLTYSMSTQERHP